MSLIFSIAAMLALILDSRTAMQGAAEAVQLCIRTAIPSLFPFFVLSGLLVPYASKLRVTWLGRLLGIPSGWESVFVLGAVSGYPVGAQCVAQGYRSGALERDQAKRMLGFCTNCGPSFIFGIVGAAFSDLWMAAAILMIGIVSAVIVGAVYPGTQSNSSFAPAVEKVSLPQAVQQALRSMASVCAWIILGKVILAFLTKWLLWRLPSEGALLAKGILELTNGCVALTACSNEGLRFVIACGMISFGGLCVAMQVRAICTDAELSTGCYLPQKAAQGSIASLLGLAFLHLPGHPLLRLFTLCAVCALFFIFPMEIRLSMVYNSARKGGIRNVVSEKDRKILPLLRLRHQAGQRSGAVQKAGCGHGGSCVQEISL